MSPEIWATIAVGAPVTIVSVWAFLSSRVTVREEGDRRRFGDLIAPFNVRLTAVEHDVEALQRDERPSPH